MRRQVSRSLARTALAVAVAVLPAACATTGATSSGLRYGEDAKKAYDEAMAAFEAHDWDEAVTLFKEVKRKYSYTRWARLAELRMAEAQWESEKQTDALGTFRAFVHDHRTDDEVPYARYRIVKGLFSQISDTIMLPPQEERDMATTLEAYRELRSYLRDYPRSTYGADVSWMLAVVTSRLVRHELYVARYYLRRDRFEAAVSRCQFALRTYDGSGMEPEAMVLLGETYLKMHKADDARAAFGQVLAKYPESAFASTARNFLGEIDARSRP